MYNANHRSVAWRLLLSAGDLLGVVTSFPVAFWVVLSFQELIPPTIDRITVVYCFLIAILELCFFRLIGLYRWEAFIYRGVMLRRLSTALLGSTLSYILLRVLASPLEGTQHNFHYVPGVLLIGVTTFFLVALSRLLIRHLEIHFLKSDRVEHVAFIGWSDRMRDVLTGLRRDSLFPVVIEGYLTQPDSHLAGTSGYNEIGTVQASRLALESREISTLVIDICGMDEQALETITEICSDLMISIMMIPWGSDIWGDRLGLRRLGGVPLLVIYDLAIGNLGNRILKRGIDLMGSMAGILLSIPVMVVLAFLIKRESPGSIFYTQMRPGYLGKPFQIIKLRSMRLDANEGKSVTRAVENDPRCLKIGTFMRKWNLDELPQFWNVLKGEMSLVGPRPEILDLIAGLRGSLHGYNLRHLCKPGMTGWASVNGLRGDTSLDERVKYDLYYIDHWSLLMDLRILFLTLLPPKNAY